MRRAGLSAGSQVTAPMGTCPLGMPSRGRASAVSRLGSPGSPPPGSSTWCPASPPPAHCVYLMTSWAVACQAALSMGFFRQEYWSGLSCPPLGDLLNPEIEPASPALAGRFSTIGRWLFFTEPLGKSIFKNKLLQMLCIFFLLCIFELNKVTQNQILIFFY